MTMKDLNPRDGASVPKMERLNPEQIALMQQVEELTKSESKALAVLAQASLSTQAAAEFAADRLEEIVDILVKTVTQFGVPLPARLSKAIADKEYDPDSLDGDKGDDDDDETEDEIFSDKKA